MSYLSVPRLHFAGQFLTSPSTINNTPDNYITSPAPPYPTYPPVVRAGGNVVLWNPMGLARFMLNGNNVNGTPLPGCTIQSIMPQKGDLLTPSNSKDPLIGASIQTSTDDSPAKIVDLDPDQQTATLFIGIRLQLVLKDGTVAFSMVSGEYLEAPNLTDYSRVGNGVFESKIMPKQIVWNTKIKSPLFKSFKDACKYGISVKFIIGQYNTDITSSTFNFGSIVGALGPVKRGEPTRASVGRKFIPPSLNTSYNSGYVQVDAQRKKLVIDFGNSTHFDYANGKSPDIFAAILIRKKITPLGLPLDYSQQNFILTAGILEIPLSSTEISNLKTNPLRFYEKLGAHSGSKMILSEYIAKSNTDFPSGSYITVSQLSTRLSYGESTSVELIARKFGQPLGGITLNVGYVPNTPTKKGLKFSRSVETLKNGKAKLEVTNNTPPLTGERADIGSQIYFLKGSWQKTAFIGINLYWPANHSAFTVKAYEKYNVPDNPTWNDNVKPIMVHFMTLYPGMKAMHDMSNYKVAKKMGNALKSVFSIPIDNPAYMPVTRELNPAKMAMVVKWVDQGMVLGN